MHNQSVRDRQDAFLQLFEPQRHALWRFVRSMVRTDHDAQDVMSETILQAYQGFHRLRDAQAFMSFLFTIAHRIVKRHNWRRRFVGEYNEESANALPDHDLLPDEHADIALLHAALQELPARMREAIVLFEILGFSIEEIRAIQGGTVSGVKSRLQRGRHALAKILGVQESKDLSPSKQQSFTNQPVL